MSLENSASSAAGTARLESKDTMAPTDGDLTIGRNICYLSDTERLPDTPNEEDANAGETSHRAAPMTFQADDSGQGVIADKDVIVQPPIQGHTLHGAPVGFILPMDHPSDAGPFTGALFLTQLENPLKLKLLNLAHHHNSDLATAVLVAWIILLSRLSGQESIDLDVGSTDEAGILVDLLSLNVDVSAELDASQLFERVKLTLGTTKTLRSAVDSPVKTSVNNGEIRFSQASFYSQSSTTAQSLSYPVSMRYCLELHLFQDAENVSLTFHYAADLYNKDTIERYAGYLQAVLVHMVASEGRSVASFDILSTAERKLLTETWNETDAEYPSERCIHHLFEDQVEKSPDAVAIVHDEKELTYLELNAVASHLAHQLIHAGVKHGDFVALLFERSIELVVAELAILKIGAAYVPIDTRTPADRLAYIVSHTDAKLLVTGERTYVSTQVGVSVFRFTVPEDGVIYEQDMPSIPRRPVESSLDTAYVMFTSGTTGVPKGVVVSHRSIARGVINNGFADIGPTDRVALATSPSFSPSTFDLWSALLNGACVVIVDNDTKLDAYRLEDVLVHHKVTSLYMTNTLLLQFAPIIGKTLSQLRYLLLGGEQGYVKAYSTVLQHGGPVRLVNRYSSTETPVSATVYTATSAVSQLKRPPIGRPSKNSRMYVLDEHRNPVPIGVVGEMYIGGPGIATGYLNLPDLTTERFLPDPFSNVEGARMYKSGDLARYLPDGNLVCVGRNDDLIKLRGYRIELGEIQTHLVRHPLIRNAAVLVVGEGEDKQLAAYVEADHHEQLADALREHLGRMLPDYMIPAAFVRLDVLPLTNRNKIDRRALPNPDFSSFATQDYVAPQGAIETTLASMWSKLLKIKRVGRQDNFFMLGGHSVLAMRLLNAIATTYEQQLPISALFSAPTLAGLAESVGNSIAQGRPSLLNIPRTSRDGPLELSYAQQRLWFLTMVGGANENYHIHRALRLRGTLDHVSLQRALNTLYVRHESIRCAFPTIDGQAVVQILPGSSGLPFVTLNIQHEQDQEAAVKQAALQEGAASFDMERGPLVRAKLIKIAEGEHVFLITMHHIITDGWSVGVMFRELNMLYEAYVTGQSDPLEPLPVQYPDYAAWQRQQLTEDRLKYQTAYWRETLAGAPVSIELPTDRPRPSQQVFAGASVPIRLDSQLTAALKALSRKHGVTMFMTILAAWSAVLSRLSRQDDIVIGTPSANRSHQQVEQLIGFFVSTLAIRIDLSEEPSTEQLLERVRKVTIAAQAHQDLPFEQVVEAVRPPRRTDINPIFQVLFAWQNNDVGTLDLKNVITVVEDIQVNVLKFDLDLELFERDSEIVGGLKYSTALFDCETIDRHIGYLEAMLRWMTTDTKESINIAPILGPSERKLLLETWNATDKPYPDNSCLHQLFENQVEKSPEAVAIMHGDRTLTYRELNSRANWIAYQLVEAGVTPGDLVMLLLDRSIDLVASQIAVLKTGAAYVPLDPNAPADRHVYVASDCGSTVLITDESHVIPYDIQGTVLRVNSKQSKKGYVHDNLVIRREGSAACSKDTAYVMYTSGSTGQPKGVVVHHRGVVRLVINNGFAEICPDDRVAFTTNPAFDPSTYQVWAPLLHGASIVVINTDTFLDPNCLAEALTHYQVTCLHMTHGILHQYAYVIGSALAKLKYLLGGAEQGQIEAYMAVLQHDGPVRLVNRYGPTETTVSATAYTATRAIGKLQRLPIGRPISNTRVYILDKHLTPVPIGVFGELYVGGSGVAKGYLNRPELTAERFLPDPFAKVQGAHMYKTGDIVHYLPDGNLVFIGRNDNQVKIRGFRVELGEIETRLADHPQVREALVLAVGETTGDKRLVAYVIAESQEGLIQTLQEYLAVGLPEYMIPSAFVRMDAFPLTNNGKIDRRALPEPNSDSFVTQDHVAPQGECEVALAAMWSDLLKIERVGRHDNFFMLGGHSLLAVRLINIIRSSLRVNLKLHMLFSAPTVSGLAHHLGDVVANTTQDDEYSVLIPLKSQGSRPPLFCVHPGQGLSWCFRGLAKYVHPEQPLYGLQCRGLDGKSSLASSIEEMTLDYIEHIRKVQPRGPYHLLGWSFGGKVAHNMAATLQSQGECVPLLVIMDTTPISPAHEEVESSVQVESIKYDEHLTRLIGASPSKDALALERKVTSILGNNKRLAAQFKPSVYSGDILLFRTTAREKTSSIDPACWRPYVRGSIEAHDVDCAHVEMDKPENIAVVGRITAARIEKLQ